MKSRVSVFIFRISWCDCNPLLVTCSVSSKPELLQELNNSLRPHGVHTVRGILQASILEWVAFPFFSGSSQSRDRTQVSCIAGGFFTSWATREAQELKSGDEMEGMRVPPLDASRTPCKENLPSVPPLSPTSWRGTSKLETPERKMISVRRWCCHCLAAKSSLTLAAPWTVCSPSGSSVHGISQARIVKWVYHFFLPTQGSNPSILHWQADSLPLSHQGSLWGDQLSIIL